MDTKKQVQLRIVGDVHGKIPQYIDLVKDVNYSIQIGDLGFRYNELSVLDPKKHRVLAGNHDNYFKSNGKFIYQTEHFLGDFGIHNVPDVGEFFFVRGGFSIDYKYRKAGKDWFPEEQLNYAEGHSALDLYEKIKPKFVISHECPVSIIPFVSTLKEWDGEPIRPSMTAELLQQMFDIHQPEFYFFGHHHKNWHGEIKNTKFYCMDELGYIDFGAKC